MHIRYATFLLLFFVAVPATASAQNLVILGIYSPEGDDALARELTTALRHSAAEVEGWSVHSTEASASQMMLAHGCTVAEPTCLEAVAEVFGVSSIIFGQMNRVMIPMGGYEEQVYIYRYSREINRIMDVTYEVRIGALSDEAACDAVADLAIARLLPPVVAPVVASVPVDEDETSVDTVVPPEAIIAPSAPSSYNHEWAGWTLIGLGAALLIADIPVLVRLNDMNSDPSMIDYRHRLAFGATGDACTNASAGNTLSVPGLDPAMASAQVDHVRGMCSEAATLEVLQYVFLFAGLASAGAGATLLATGVLVSPSVSAERATLTVSGSF